MKLAALGSGTSRDRQPKYSRRRSSAFDLSRDWTTNYEGLPNTEIIDVEVVGSGALITLRNDAQEVFQRRISRLAYVVGRRGSLRYLSSELLKEMDVTEEVASLMSGQTLRYQASEDLEVAPDTFVVGSLTGDSLIRFAYGSCASTAGKIMSAQSGASSKLLNGASRPHTPASVSKDDRRMMMNGLDGHNGSPHAPQ